MKEVKSPENPPFYLRKPEMAQRWGRRAVVLAIVLAISVTNTTEEGDRPSLEMLESKAMELREKLAAQMDKNALLKVAPEPKYKVVRHTEPIAPRFQRSRELIVPVIHHKNPQKVAELRKGWQALKARHPEAGIWAGYRSNPPPCTLLVADPCVCVYLQRQTK